MLRRAFALALFANLASGNFHGKTGKTARDQCEQLCQDCQLQWPPNYPQGDHRESSTQKLTPVFAWSQISFNLGGKFAPLQANGSAFYIPANNFPFGVERWKDKVFITIPRLKPGIPATVNWLSLTYDARTTSPALRPYPDLVSNTVDGRTGLEKDYPIVSVFRPAVDRCDRLWLMDQGIDTPRQVQEPAILVYDLNTDQLVSRYIFTSDVIQNGVKRGFVSMTVDTQDGDCSNAFAYVPDVTEPGLVIYSFRQNRAWRMSHNYFYPDPLHGDFDVNGIQYRLKDGIISLVLLNTHDSGRPVTYALFHPMCSYKEFAVSTELLQNETLATRRFHFSDVKIFGERGPNTQSATHAIDPSTGVVFYPQIAKNSIACWNTHRQLLPRNVATLAQDNQLLDFPADISVDSEGEVWILTNKYPQYAFSTLDLNVINLRVYKMNARAAIARTACEV